MDNLLIKLFSIIMAFFLCFNGVSFAYDVVFNTQSKKYHKVSCVHAKKCTKNCVRIPKESAQKRGGHACKVCGG